MKSELLKGISEEQLERARACKSTEELLALAKAEGVELTDEQLEAVNGGGCVAQPDPQPCPHCMSENTTFDYYDHSENVIEYRCLNCGHKWEGKFK